MEQQAHLLLEPVAAGKEGLPGHPGAGRLGERAWPSTQPHSQMAPAKPGIDPKLLPFLSAATEREAQACLDELLEKAEPLIQGVIRRQLREHLRRPVGRMDSQRRLDAEDVYGQVLAELVRDLRKLRAGDPAAPPSTGGRAT
jgi:hypothetical protein